jgi:replicative DNA helicase
VRREAELVNADLLTGHERVLIGAAMMRPDMADRLAEVVTGESFAHPRHRRIWAAIGALRGRDEPAEPLRVLAELGEDAERAGGGVYLHACLESVPVLDSAPTYAAEVAAAAGARWMRMLGERLINGAQLDDVDARETVAAEVQQALTGAAPATSGAPSWHALAVDGAAFVLDQPSTVPAVWGDGDRVLWADGEALMLCGPSGVGKTTIAGQLLAARLGLLTGVLGLPVIPGEGRALYLACDRPSQIARSLRRTMRPEWRDVLADRLRVWKGPPPADFAQSPEWMLVMARKYDADTLVVDSIKDVALGISDDAVGAGYNRARQAALAAGVQVLELHHQVKRAAGGGAPTSLADVYGSVWVTAGAGSVVLLWGDPGDPLVKLTHLKQPAEEVGPLDVLHDHKDGTSAVHRDPDLVKLAAASPAGLTAPEAAKLLFESGKPSNAQIEKARRRLDKLVNQGRLVTGVGRVGGAGGSDPKTYYAAAEEPEVDR